MADVTGATVSRPFDFAQSYRKKGSYWELKDARNPLCCTVSFNRWITTVWWP